SDRCYRSAGVRNSVQPCQWERISMSQQISINVTVNGVAYQHTVEPRLLLSDFTRHELNLTGTHIGCEHGVCGACTILFDGAAVRSCIMLAVQADGHVLTTVAGLGARQTH